MSGSGGLPARAGAAVVHARCLLNSNGAEAAKVHGAKSWLAHVMARRSSTSSPSALPRSAQRSLKALTKGTPRSGTRIAGEAARAAAKRLEPPRRPGDWLAGVAVGPGGARRYHLYRPPDLQSGECLPLLVMLHGCGQTGRDFALSTRMNFWRRASASSCCTPSRIGSPMRRAAGAGTSVAPARPMPKLPR